MKKRGFKPTTRTFTTLINAYAGLKHSDDTMDRRAPRTPEPRTVSRVSLIFDQAQSHLATQVAELERLENQNDPEELGLKTAGMVDEAFVEGDGVDINIGPVNAYLKFLAKYGMMGEMEKVFTAMPASGPYTINSPRNLIQEISRTAKYLRTKDLPLHHYGTRLTVNSEMPNHLDHPTNARSMKNSH
jgi:hypothetical protein